MVRRIDGDARRAELAQAVLRLVLREGLDAASVRSVAAESGLSTGSVRHFFGTQQELLTFTMRAVMDAVQERLTVASAIEDPEERALALLGELVPLTPTTRAEAFAHLQFVNRARFDAALAPLARESFAAIRSVCAQVVAWLQEVGRVRADLDPSRAAVTVGALLDGLTFELLLAPDLITAAEAQEVLRDHLRRLADPDPTGRTSS